MQDMNGPCSYDGVYNYRVENIWHLAVCDVLVVNILPNLISWKKRKQVRAGDLRRWRPKGLLSITQG